MRCAFDHQRLQAADTALIGAFRVHVKDGSPVEPAHEVIEGRFLDLSGEVAALQLSTSIDITYARRHDNAEK